MPATIIGAPNFWEINVLEAKRLNELNRELAIEEASGGITVQRLSDKGGTTKKVVTVPTRRKPVRFMIDKGLSERRSLKIVRMSSSFLRYLVLPDRNAPLKEKIVPIAQRNLRYGSL